MHEALSNFALAYQGIGFVFGVFWASQSARMVKVVMGEGPWTLVAIVLTSVFVWPAVLLKMWSDDNDRWSR